MRNMLHDILDMGFSQWQEKLTAMGERCKENIDANSLSGQRGGGMKGKHRRQPSLGGQ